MRSFLIAFTALVTPGLAYAAPQCALPSGPATAFLPIAQSATPAPAPDATAGPAPIPADQIERIPALRRIASKGAQLLDLGTEHGLRGVFARQGDTFQVFYLTPDGQAVIGGVMWEASGRNVTRQQVTPVEGAIPTVTIGAPSPAPAHPGGTATAPAATSLMAAVEGTTAGSAGDPKAPKLWVYIDPLCSYSVRAMDQLRPYVAAGRVQLAVIPLSVLDYEDQGRSTVAALAMLSLPAGDMVAAWARTSCRVRPTLRRPAAWP